MKPAKRIEVVDYQPAWAMEFAQLKAIFERHLGEGYLSIEHVGSTSVPGLAAKPVLDIDIIVEQDADLVRVLQRMESLGYVHVGDQGVAGREVLKPATEFAPLGDTGQRPPKHHLYVGKRDALSLRNHLLLRDHLQSHPPLVQRYGALKKQLAQQFPFDIDRYIHGKTGLILEILQAAGLDEDALAMIAAKNLLPEAFVLHRLESDDLGFLKEMFYLSLFVPPDEAPFAKSIIEAPHLARYHEEWGRPSDYGLKVTARGHAMGASWSRFFPAGDPAYGFVDESIPEIGIAIRPAARGLGLGTRLLQQLIALLSEDGIEAASLSVDRRNPAIHLYRRLGFELYRQEGTACVMLKKW